MTAAWALLDGVLAALLLGGGGLACAPRLPTASPLARWVAGLVLAGLALYLAGWLSWVFTGRTFSAIGPLVALVVIAWIRRGSIASLARDPAVRFAALAWLGLTLWGTLWMMQIWSFSGGGWAKDWFEHYQRACFFLVPVPIDILFVDLYALPSRPPLANLFAAMVLQTFPGGFPGFQLITIVTGAAIVVPALLAAERSRRRFPAVAATFLLLLLINPMVVQNLTFPWTKLTTGFWVLAGWFLLRAGLRGDGDARLRLFGWLALAGGLVTHYSAGPWLVVALGCWAVWRARRPSPAELATDLKHGLVAAVTIIGPWLVWCLTHFGWSATSGSTTTAQAWARQSPWDRVATGLSNIFNTLVPHPLRDVDGSLFTQASALGSLRDHFFNLYQVNLPAAFGFTGLVVAVGGAWRFRRHLAERAAWRSAPTVTALIILGILVHTPADAWGLAHICLVPLVVWGLATMAPWLAQLPARWHVLLIAAGLIDLTLGVVLHHGLQGAWAPAWWAEARGPAATIEPFSVIAQVNWTMKLAFGVTFWRDLLPGGSLVPWTGISIAAGLLVVVASRIRHPARSLRAALPPAAALAVLVLFLGAILTRAPQHAWNDVRLAAAAMVPAGLSPYAAPDGGPVSTWLYGPSPLLLWSPAALVADPLVALDLLALLNFGLLAGALALALRFRSAAPPHLVTSLVIAAALCPVWAWEYATADNVALAAALAANALLARRRLALAALATVIALTAKQTYLPLLAAQCFWLFRREGVTTAVAWGGSVALGGFATLALAALRFGWEPLRHTLLDLPAALPWASPLAKLTPLAHWPWLLALVVAPALLFAATWRRWRDPAHFASLPAWATLALWPGLLAGFFTVGGTVNSLLPAVLLVPALTTKIVSSRWRNAATATAALWLGAQAVLLFLAAAPQAGLRATGIELAREFDGRIHFPWHPTLQAKTTGRFYHTEDGLLTRIAVGQPYAPAAIARHLPAGPLILAYGPEDPRGFLTATLPATSAVVQIGAWTLYVSPPPPMLNPASDVAAP